MLAEDHADFFFANMAVRDGVHWSAPVVPRGAEERLDWEIILELAERMGGGISAVRPIDAVMRILGIRVTPATIANVALRLGPYGDHFLPWSKGLNRERLNAQPHGMDLGPLKPGFRRRVFHRGGRIQLATPVLMQAMDALARDLASPKAGPAVADRTARVAIEKLVDAQRAPPGSTTPTSSASPACRFSTAFQ